MKIEDAFDELERFAQALSNARPVMAFEVRRVPAWDGPFKKWFRKEVPGVGAAKSSGVYLIADMNRAILYIGKATAGNLAAEIWGKFGAPTNLDDNDNPTFSNSLLAKWAPEDKYRDLIVSGNVIIAAATVQPQVHASLAEVYLQVWCERRFGSLPVLNKRIG